MIKINVIRAWKDAEYRNSLTAEQRAALPAHPAGEIELSDTELGMVVGGRASDLTTLLRTCTVTGDCCSAR